MNTWPDGKRKALSPEEHEIWNAKTYPGTRQLCVNCCETTGRCEDDSMFWNHIRPLCENCYCLKHSYKKDDE